MITECRHLWSPQFIEFLGISDERVKRVCAYDQKCAQASLIEEGEEAQMMQSSSNAYYEEGGKDSMVNFNIADSSQVMLGGR